MAPMSEPVEGQSGASSIRRVLVGLGLWCAGLTIFAAVTWIRTYRDACIHDQIFHNDTFHDCEAIVTSTGLLRTRAGFYELVLFILVVAVPVFVLGPVVLRGLRARS